MTTILQNGLPVSPLFTIPWISLAIFRIDWLHCADQGVAADFLGNLFVVLRDKLPGNNVDEKTQSLWELVQGFYESKQIDDRLQDLTKGMIQSSGKAPKLRCSAACCRALIPWAAAAAEALLDTNCPLENQMIVAAKNLASCYQCLSSDSIFYADLLKDHSIKFAASYTALSVATAHSPKTWRVKPKMHMFLELCSEGTRPSMFWCYRDEDWGGFVAKCARRRGGILSVQAFSVNVHDRFCIYQPFLKILKES